jgi:N utilization substance protein B
MDIAGLDPREALTLFWQNFEPGADTRNFTAELVEGVWRERKQIDQLIADAIEHWRLGRLPRVDLNLLRLATYELLAYPHLAPGVTINEAIEIARRYCSDEAPMFVNGVLDRIATVIGKKARSHEPTL